MEYLSISWWYYIRKEMGEITDINWLVCKNLYKALSTESWLEDE